MNYDLITEKIFNDIKPYFNGVLGINNKSLITAYKEYNCEFNFIKTQNYFKTKNLFFTYLKDFPIIQLHALTDKSHKNYFLLLDPKSNPDFENLFCI